MRALRLRFFELHHKLKSVIKKFTSSKILAIPVVILFLSTYFFIIGKMKKNAESEIGNSLETVLVTSQQALKSWQSTLLATTKVWAQSKEIKKMVVELLRVPHESLKESKWQPAIRQHLISILKTHDYRGFFIIDKDRKNLSSLRDQNIGAQNLLSKQDGFFKQIWQGKTVISEMIESDVVLKGMLQVSIFTGSPIVNDNGEVIAAFCFRIDPSTHFSKILKRGRIGGSGETYAISKKGMMASNTRFREQLLKINLLKKNQYAPLNIRVADPGSNLAENPQANIAVNAPLTLMAKSVINSPGKMKIQSHLTGYRDYRGVFVAGAWVWDDELKLILMRPMRVFKKIKEQYRF